MLARPDKYSCIECGTRYGTDAFQYHYGDIDNGPAYWCDRGLLCSAKCSLQHHQKRVAEGTVQQMPAPDPFENGFVFKD